MNYTRKKLTTKLIIMFQFKMNKQFYCVEEFRFFRLFKSGGFTYYSINFGYEKKKIEFKRGYTPYCICIDVYLLSITRNIPNCTS